jgi:hypothetical protein
MYGGVLGVACEHTYGIYRSAHLTEYPSPNCVEHAISQVPKIENLEYTQSPEYRDNRGRRWRSQHASYSRGPIRVGFGIIDDPNNDFVGIGQHFSSKESKPTKAQITAARELMMDVEEAIEKYCRISELSTQVKEYCSGVKCD